MHSITVVEPDLQFPATGNRVGRLQRLLSVDAGKVACWDCYGTGHNKVEKVPPISSITVKLRDRAWGHAWAVKPEKTDRP